MIPGCWLFAAIACMESADEVHDVRSNNHPILGRGELELCPVAELALAGFVGADRIDAPGAEQARDLRR